MNRWIEHEKQMVNLDLYHRIIVVRNEIRLLNIEGESDRLDFVSEEKSKEFYEKIKSKLNLTEWE